MPVRPGGPQATAAHQSVRAESGFAYGLIGADLHVHGDGMPVYLLANWAPPAPTSDAWLRELPSRLLNARHAVVDFTGRQDERASLHHWLRESDRLSMRWLHGVGGQGKTRLADQLAKEAIERGWKAVVATHAPGSVVGSASHDLRPAGHTGLLLIVDYADRWPLNHLTLLLGNSLLHQHDTVPTRVLLLARTDEAWPTVRAATAELGGSASDQRLGVLPEAAARAEMFAAARTAFTRHYGCGDLGYILPAVPLDSAAMGLTLSVHMAALVAVDARVNGRPTPADAAGLTVYLLDREHLHWALMAGDGTHRLGATAGKVRTSPEVMHRAVFAAALAGPQSRRTGLALLRAAGVRASPHHVLEDHARYYPAPDPESGTVLEPPYPDRLAEDFLALTVPGHRADYPDQPWAVEAAGGVVALRGADGTRRERVARSVTFLAAATERWPHVGHKLLFPLLRTSPELALEAGSAALTALAAGAEPALLEQIEKLFPQWSDSDLDTGIASIVERLSQDRLLNTDDPLVHATVLQRLANVLEHAGRYERALEHAEEAVHLWRRLAARDPQHARAHAIALDTLSSLLSTLGHTEDALARAQESIEVRQARTGADRKDHTSGLAVAASNISLRKRRLGRRREALEDGLAALTRQRRLADIDPDTHEPGLAVVLSNVGGLHAEIGEYAEGLALTWEAVVINRRLAEQDPGRHLPRLATALNNLGARLGENGRNQEALRVTEESVAHHRRLVKLNQDAHEDGLARALDNLGVRLSEADRWGEALNPALEAVEIRRRQVARRPRAHEPELAQALDNIGRVFTWHDRVDEALACSHEAVALYRRLADVHPDAHGLRLADSLYNLAWRQMCAWQRHDPLPSADQAAAEALALWEPLAADLPADRREAMDRCRELRDRIRAAAEAKATGARLRRELGLPALLRRHYVELLTSVGLEPTAANMRGAVERVGFMFFVEAFVRVERDGSPEQYRTVVEELKEPFADPARWPQQILDRLALWWPHEAAGLRGLPTRTIETLTADPERYFRTDSSGRLLSLAEFAESLTTRP
ncbi:tetratricopeptide repeat protein [Streptomyces deccanensis]|uniref:tetratricopeptide repeat protein n=1 Tax=Streptomyces deccanensis TaxID=424188 RepID=UPI001EFB8646|nr:tetratricopeptide repeat protein [Streptomyces deccanensis]ULR48548.1 tetratricopeptide repeat protein [Streptomyces deccanensis]